jgi:hypothetical protein
MLLSQPVTQALLDERIQEANAKLRGFFFNNLTAERKFRKLGSLLPFE